MIVQMAGLKPSSSPAGATVPITPYVGSRPVVKSGPHRYGALDVHVPSFIFITLLMIMHCGQCSSSSATPVLAS